MKSFLLFTVTFLALNAVAQTLCVDGMAGNYPCRNMDLMKFITLQECGCDPAGNSNDVWGWASPTSGKEYAILGCSNVTSFIDVTDPVNPFLVGTLPTHSANSLWRDVESHGNWLFVVSEAQGHGMQIFDLNQLDEVNGVPFVFSETAHYPGFGNCHTVNVDPVSGYVYAYGTNTYSGGEHIVDVSDPLNPVLAGGYDVSGYTHDGFAWTYDGPDADYTGREIVIACNGRSNSDNDKLVFVDVTNKLDCQLIGEYNFGGEATSGYFHQGWITKDKKYFLMNDELDEMALGNNQQPYGTRTHIFNITNLDAVTYEGFYEGTSVAIDHNLYALDHFIYESNYRSGVRVLDAIRVQNSILSEVAYFDVIPANDFAQFSGTWSNYPYLPSGIVLASSMYDGMFIVKPTIITTSEEIVQICPDETASFEVGINADLAFPLTVAIEGLGNATANADLIEGQGSFTVAITGVENLESGDYSANLLLVSNFGEQYEIPLSVSVCSANRISEAQVEVLSIFPNPAHTVLQIKIPSGTQPIEIMDATGRIVHHENAPGNSVTSIDIRQLASGHYIVRSGNARAQFVKE